MATTLLGYGGGQWGMDQQMMHSGGGKNNKGGAYDFGGGGGWGAHHQSSPAPSSYMTNTPSVNGDYMNTPQLL